MKKTPNIVILDGYAANPGDLSWKELESIGNLTIYDRTAPEDVVDRCRNANIVFTNKTVISGEAMASMPEVVFIGVLATGYNVVDIKTAQTLGITVCNVPAYSTMSVAQNVFALLLDVTNEVAHYSSDVRRGSWSSSPDFAYTDTTLIELAGKRMGIVGYGAIGSKVAEIAQAFGMEVCAYTSKEQEKLGQVVKTDLDTLFMTSDVVSLHCPLTDDTYHLVNETRLELMKPTAILINTGRGQLVDEQALADALNYGKIYAACVDVLSQEPPQISNPLPTARNCRITPHISWATKEARERLLAISVENLRAFMAGTPQNVVS